MAIQDLFSKAELKDNDTLGLKKKDNGTLLTLIGAVRIQYYLYLKIQNITRFSFQNYFQTPKERESVWTTR